MDISSDSTLLASGSADKNLKIWGLDFGDCHRSLFAHGDSLMAVAFQPNTHYVFTAGEDFNALNPCSVLYRQLCNGYAVPCRCASADFQPDTHHVSTAGPLTTFWHGFCTKPQVRLCLHIAALV